MKKYSLRFMFVLMSTLLILAGCGSNQQVAETTNAEGKPEVKEAKELKLVSFLAQDHRFTKDMIPLYMKKIEEGTEGAVKITWIGGPESIPAKDQFDAVKDGMVDLVFNASSFYVHLMPESDSLLLSPYSAAEERENGYFDFMSKRFEQQGVTYLGRWLMNSPFYFWTNREIQSIDELKGSKFRSNPVYHEIFKQLGISPINVDPGDVYTSLERRMVDGFGFPVLGPRDSGWTEVTKYIIDEPFLEQNCTILMNPSVLASLSPDIQKKIMELTKEFEIEAAEHWKQQNAEEMDALKQSGVQAITLSAEEKENFQNLVKETKWRELEGKIEANLYQEIRAILYKN